VYTWLVEGKAKDIKVLDVKSSVTDMVVIVSASSARHAKSLADHIIMESKKEKFEILSTEGYQAGTWVLVDLNDIVVHIFQEETRELFQLENLWREAESVVLSERAKKV
ncbi:MAG: ribosome silencing factor, partial [Mailhella sp.]|nr:ribosome silencing factor [Mailhella sp.]